MVVSNRNLLFQGSIFRVYVKLPEGKSGEGFIKKNCPDEISMGSILGGMRFTQPKASSRGGSMGPIFGGEIQFAKCTEFCNYLCGKKNRAFVWVSVVGFSSL